MPPAYFDLEDEGTKTGKFHSTYSPVSPWNNECSVSYFNPQLHYITFCNVLLLQVSECIRKTLRMPNSIKVFRDFKLKSQIIAHAQHIFSATTPTQSTSHHIISLHCSTLHPAQFQQKDERALPDKLRSCKFFPLSRNKCNVSNYIPFFSSSLFRF
jgi:hypothetical protein